MITHIIFDNNGVLTTSDSEVCYEKTAAFLGVRVDDYKKIVNKFVVDLDEGKITQNEFYAAILKEGGFDVSVSELRKAHLSGYVRKPEVQEFAKKLGERYEIALLSNFGDAFREEWCKVWKLDEIFSNEMIFVSFEIGIAKPDEKIYLYVLEKLDVEAGNVVFIDDNLENVESAKKVGINAILFESLEELKKDLGKLGVEI